MGLKVLLCYPYVTCSISVPQVLARFLRSSRDQVLARSTNSRQDQVLARSIMAQPNPLPLLYILPPSSESDSWSPFLSPAHHHTSSPAHHHASSPAHHPSRPRICTKRNREGMLGQLPWEGGDCSTPSLALPVEGEELV